MDLSTVFCEKFMYKLSILCTSSKRFDSGGMRTAICILPDMVNMTLPRKPGAWGKRRAASASMAGWYRLTTPIRSSIWVKPASIAAWRIKDTCTRFCTALGGSPKRSNSSSSRSFGRFAEAIQQLVLQVSFFFVVTNRNNFAIYVHPQTG